jgi:hypothetical protein
LIVTFDPVLSLLYKRKQKRNIKFYRNIKQKKMKTRFFTITLIILFTALSVFGAANSRVENISRASGHENVTEQNFTDLIPDFPTLESTTMEEWIDSRNSWEQEEQVVDTSDFLNDPAMLVEWVTTRDNWEQEDQDLTGDNFPGKSSLLDEWIAGTDNWEQK